jgi:MoxR-like ATPase
VLCGRSVANLSDLWVLRHVWDRAEQIGPLAGLIAGLLEKAEAESPHPRSRRPEQVDAEALAAEIETAERELAKGLKLVEIARLKERLQSVIDRAAWVTDAGDRGQLLARGGALLEKLA